MVADGKRVFYAGLGEHGLLPGDQGSALDGAGGGYKHVLWRTGALAGQAVPVFEADLSETPPTGLLDDSLDVPAPRLAVRQVYEEQGGDGLMVALANTGALIGVSQIAQDVVAYAASRVRADDSLAPALSQLEPEDADSVVGLVATACMREALGG